MKKVIINGEKFVDSYQFHKYIKEILELPEFYGENLDALWDCLTGYIDLPLLVVWENFEKSKEFMGNEAEEILQLFREAQEELEKFFMIKVR